MLKEKIQTFPQLPGVYLMKDASGKILYVGKAVNLQSRVRSYFRKSGDGRPLIPYLMARVDDIDYLVTDTEKEALILENNLIKQHRPRYNVFFRDDKTYCSLRLDLDSPYPRPILVRRIRNDGALYFGPYASSRAVKSTLRFLQELFPFRVCSENTFRHRSRPCLYHQIGRCPAPCRGKISPAEYREILEGLVLFLRGRKRDLLVSLRRRLKRESDRLEYEKAARTLAGIRAVEETLEKQKVSRLGTVDRDIVALESSDGASVFQVLSIRDGKMSAGRGEFFGRIFPDDREAMGDFLAQFYDGRLPLPREIILPFSPANAGALKDLLAERRGGPVAFMVPVRGEKKKLLSLARKNARAVLRQRQTSPGPEEVLLRMRSSLKLRRVPRLIECFDISNLGGAEAVGSMVVFRQGEKHPAAYRHYRLRTEKGADDYGMFSELLERRFRRAVTEGGMADLIVVDGGKGQLNVALQVLKDLSIPYPDVIALAKEKRLPSGRVVRDRVYLPGRKNPAALHRASPVLRLLMRIRDEAHRFAVTYHRRLRMKKALSSPLDSVPGIGPVLRKRLLDRFQTVDVIKRASPEELNQVKGVSLSLAKNIRGHLNRATSPL